MLFLELPHFFIHSIYSWISVGLTLDYGLLFFFVFKVFAKNEDQPKPTLDVDEDLSSPLKKARTFRAMPTDVSLNETGL